MQLPLRHSKDISRISSLGDRYHQGSCGGEEPDRNTKTRANIPTIFKISCSGFVAFGVYRVEVQTQNPKAYVGTGSRALVFPSESHGTFRNDIT